jgi:hypothetical protein
MPEFEFNPGRPIKGEALEPYYFDASERSRIVCYKNGDFDTVRSNCNHDYLRYVIDSLPEKQGFKYRLLDVKFHVLEANECTCIPGYHLDGSIRTTMQDGENGEQYTLFIAGPEETATEFLDQPLVTEVNPAWSFKEISENVSKAVPKGAKGRRITPFVAHSYDYRYLHRGAVVVKPAVRLLVRQAFSNNIRPSNQIVQCVGNKI